MLDEAGWSKKDTDGVRELAGVKFRFIAIVPDREMEKAAVYVQEQFRRIGVRMEVQILELDLVRKKLRIGDYDAAFLVKLRKSSDCPAA